jgi:hypothetical protein
MKRRVLAIGLVAGALAAGSFTPWYTHLMASSRNFEQSFRDLESSGRSLNPVERFVFSLVLANTQTPANP